MVCAPDPPKITVPPVLVKVPLWVNVPRISRLLPEPVKLKLAPLPMVILFTTAAVLICGALAVPEPMLTSVIPVGTPPHQLDAVFHELLVAPSHTPLERVVTINESAFTDAQLPLCTTARKAVGWLIAGVVKLVVVLAMVLQLLYGDTELSQRMTLPVWPARVKLEVLPVHTGVLPPTVPPVDTGLTVTTVESALDDAHTPLCTTARKAVLWVKIPEV